jgi:phospholipase/carboxylesterase
VALSYPEKVNKVVAMSGYINLDIVTEDYLKNNLNKLKIFASHGTVDQVIPVDWARKTPAILEKLGVATTYKEYPVGHGVAPQNFFDFKNWLVEN